MVQRTLQAVGRWPSGAQCTGRDGGGRSGRHEIPFAAAGLHVGSLPAHPLPSPPLHCTALLCPALSTLPLPPSFLSLFPLPGGRLSCAKSPLPVSSSGGPRDPMKGQVRRRRLAERPSWPASQGRCPFSSFLTFPCGGDFCCGWRGWCAATVWEGRGLREGGPTQRSSSTRPSTPPAPPCPPACAWIVPVARCALCLRVPPAPCWVGTLTSAALRVGWHSASLFPVDQVTHFPFCVARWFGLGLVAKAPAGPEVGRGGEGGGGGAVERGVVQAERAPQLVWCPPIRVHKAG